MFLFGRLLPIPFLGQPTIDRPWPFPRRPAQNADDAVDDYRVQGNRFFFFSFRVRADVIAVRDPFVATFGRIRFVVHV